MDFVLLPAGVFAMGSPEEEPERSDDETQHPVTLSQPFYMQTTEVTQAQWTEVMDENPSEFPECGGDCPVESVSWEEIQEFVQRLNDNEGGCEYRLPTEAEWEYAARAGTPTPFAFGNCLSTDQANYDGNWPYEDCPAGDYRDGPILVGSFPPNAWGLYDMHGNVAEWCLDWYDDYPPGEATDPAGPDSGYDRVVRGGSWWSDEGGCRSAVRDLKWPSHSDENLGFRLIRTRCR
jgi:formylglycine-generating enzyme required for sulfatase activity